jgi:hypothetical protein
LPACSAFVKNIAGLHLCYNGATNTNNKTNYIILQPTFTQTFTQTLLTFTYFLRLFCIQNETLLTQLCYNFNTTLTTKVKQSIYYKQGKLWLLNKIRKRLRVRLRNLFNTYLTQILNMVYLYCKNVLVKVLNQVPSVKVNLKHATFEKFQLFEHYAQFIIPLHLRRFCHAI